MATSKTLPRATTAQATINGNHGDVRSLILLALPAVERATLTKNLEFVEMATHCILHEAGEPIKHAYFIEGGLASVLSVMADGKSVAVGLVGKEGFVGLPLVVGFSSGPTQVVMQVAGSAYRMGSADFKEVLSHSAELERKLKPLRTKSSLAGGPDGCLQSITRSGRAFGAVASDESGQIKRRCHAADPRISCPDARDTTSECYRSRWYLAKSRSDNLRSRQRDD